LVGWVEVGYEFGCNDVNGYRCGESDSDLPMGHQEFFAFLLTRSKEETRGNKTLAGANVMSLYSGYLSFCVCQCPMEKFVNNNKKILIMVNSDDKQIDNTVIHNSDNWDFL